MRRVKKPRKPLFIKGMFQMFFKKDRKKSYDPKEKIPMIHASICNGEEVAGFKNLRTGAFEEIMFIRDDRDLDDFKRQYGITGDIGKTYITIK